MGLERPENYVIFRFLVGIAAPGKLYFYLQNALGSSGLFVSAGN